MRKLIAMLLLIFWPGVLLSQNAVFFGQNFNPPSGTCTPPTMTNRWPMYASPPNTCTGGVTCTNGMQIEQVVDPAGGNTLSQPSGSKPTYTTGQINGLAAATFNGTGSLFPITSPLSSSNVSWTYYAVVNVPSNPSGSHAIIGCSFSSGCLEWRMDSGKSLLLNQGIAGLVEGATLTAGYHLLLAEYNQSTGLATLKTCAGGSCTTDATATVVSALSTNVDEVGAAFGVGDFWNSGIAEVGFINSVSGTIESQVAAWGACKFAL
jgi:hypothetical protein